MLVGFEDFSILSWNVRGAVRETGRLFIRDMLGVKKPDIVILVETRCQFNRVRQFWTSLGIEPVFLEEAQGFSGGIWVLKHSSANYNLRLTSQHRQAITFEIWKESLSWVCTAVYASPVPAQREILWNHLTTLRTSITNPLMLMGDFNEVLHSSEVRGGNFVSARANRFGAVLEGCNLVDLGLEGANFTWFRSLNNRVVLSKRLDRALGDIDWRLAFPEAYVETLSRVHSDHCPLLLRCGNRPHFNNNRPFRFIATWAEHPEFQALVENAWRQGEENIDIKLERVREAATTFNKEVFWNIHRRKRRVEAKLKGVQRELDQRITSYMLQHGSDLQKELQNILKQEELLWYQKARDNRVRLGDRKTSYFHAHCVIRRKRNRVHKLRLDSGEWCEEPKQLEDLVQQYYQQLFAASTTQPSTNLDQEKFPRLSEAAKASIADPIGKEEVRKALMAMKSYTAPGPDGFQPFFFKKYWDKVGDALWGVVHNAFCSGKVDEKLLEILMVIIPKVDHPTTVKEFRPISLCNVTYKLITKVLVDRLRPFLSYLIGPMQSSFLPGRGTMDNAFVAQEIVHQMGISAARKGTMAFKIDLEKAYDSISWDFLKETLIMFNIPPQVIDLIMCCVSSASISILWNGARCPSFKPGRGLRQGDPLSPYLFVLCMERLSCHIQALVDKGEWKPVRVAANGPLISHLFFADDVLLFSQASKEQAGVLAKAMSNFCERSGLKVNIQKSKAITSKGVRPEVREEISRIAPIPFVRDLGKYLGFPLTGGKVKSRDFHYLLDNLSTKMASWKTNLLNMAGRICLVKSVMASIPTYMMQVFWMPRNILQKMNQSMRSFIWSKGRGNRGWHRTNWRTLTQEKDEGGLGIKDMVDANTALMGKATWNMITHPGKLWVQVMTNKYLRNDSFFQVKAQRKDSPIWRGILKARDQLQEGFRFRIGDGRTSVWYEDWSGLGKLAEHVPYVNIADTQFKLKDLIVDNQWHLNTLYTNIPQAFKDKLLLLQPLTSSSNKDVWVWIHGSKGNFTVKEAYQWLNNKDRVVDRSYHWAWIWKLKVPEKVRIFIWTILQDALPTNDKRVRCNLATSPSCTRCSHPVEDAFHCLRECPHAREIWLRMGALSWSGFNNSNLENWLQMLARSVHSLRFLSGLWGNWKWRNNWIFEDQSWNLETAWRKLCHEHDSFVLISRTPNDKGTFMASRWEPLPLGAMKLNTDGSYRGEENVMGCGGLLRDHEGKWAGGFVSHEPGGNAITAEARALLQGLKLSWEKGYRHVRCEVDCSELLAILDDREALLYFQEAREIREWLRKDWFIDISHIDRECNASADCMAKLAAKSPPPGSRNLDSPFMELETLLLRDKLGSF